MPPSGLIVQAKPAAQRADRIRVVLICLIAALYIIAGRGHLVNPEPFLRITPDWVPFTEAVVYWTGIAELLGAVALLQPFWPALRKAGAIGLAIYALCVWPANINHFAMDMARADDGWGLGYHIPRMIAQPFLIWATLWAAKVTFWPFAKAGQEQNPS